MKKMMIVLASVMMLTLAVSISHAAVNVTERPEIKININGQTGSYGNVPILLNNRTLLPLVAILTNLGVEDDGKHILWNKNERSIMVYKDDIKIFLKLDSKTAYINDVAKEIDVAPITYKDRTYIPASFIALSLGKKVTWDGASNMVLIRDESEYNRVKSVLEKADAAMNAVDRYKQRSKGDLILTTKGKNEVTTRVLNADMDVKNKISYGKMNNTIDGFNSTWELCMTNQSIYFRYSPAMKWQPKEMSEADYRREFIFDIFKSNQMLYTGLMMQEDPDGKEIILSGKVYASKYLKTFMELQGISQYVYDTAEVQIAIAKDTYRVNSIHLKLSGKTGSSKFTMEITDTYTDYNGDFKVTVPANLK